MNATTALRSLAAALVVIPAPTAHLASMPTGSARSDVRAAVPAATTTDEAPAELLLRNRGPRPLHGLVRSDDATRVIYVPVGGSQTIWLRWRTAIVEIDGPPRFVKSVDLPPRSRVVVDVPAPR